MISILIAFHLFAVEVLDAEMSAIDKKTTGVYKLSDKEKAAFQHWIDAHYQKRPETADSSTSPQPIIKGVHPTLSENLKNSQYLRLSDGTLWNVRPEDVPLAQAWITPVEIIVSQSTNPFYPYKLTNKVSGTSILARKVESLPPQNSPPLAPKNSEKNY